MAFPYANLLFSLFFLCFLVAWIIFKGPPLKETKIINYPLALFLTALLISISFSINKMNSLQEAYKYLSGLLVLTAAASLNNGGKKALLQTILLAGSLICLLAIYQYLFGFQHLLGYLLNKGDASPFTWDYITRKRAFLPFITPNLLGGYLAMLIPLALMNKYRVFLLTLLSIALFLTQSLGALLSVSLALLLYLYLQGTLNKKKMICLAGLLLTTGLILILRSISQKHYLQPNFSATMRMEYWKDTWEIIKASPLTGVGIGNFDLPQVRYAHNSYLQIWAEMGVMGIFSFIWLVFSVLKASARHSRALAQKNNTCSLIAANVAFLTHNMLDFSFFLPEISLLWWAILGLTVSELIATSSLNAETGP